VVPDDEVLPDEVLLDERRRLLKLPAPADVDPHERRARDDGRTTPGGGPHMIETLEMVYEYRLLRAKQEQLGLPLNEVERARLVGLARALEGEAAAHDPRRGMQRVAAPVGVQFTLPGSFGAGQVLNVSGGGMAIATREPPAEGTRVIVRMAVPATGVEYVFPCRVVWRAREGTPGMGVSFDGLPTRMAVRGSPDSGVWRMGALRFGDKRDDPMAA
jgi:hypothetical protein